MAGALAAVAGEIGASGHAAFTVAATAERQLLCRLEGGATAPFLPFLAAGFASEVAGHALASSAPFWWSGHAAGDASERLQTLRWAARSAVATLPQPGIGFPFCSERGACGAFLFWGADIELSPEALFPVHARLCALFETSVFHDRDASTVPPRISKRELECLKLTTRGCTSDDIASLLSISPHTANQYLSSASERLDAVNRTHAMAKALRLGLID